MPLQVPILDDLNFERLLEEAKRRIPSFTPEWTNYGVESDPGITLVQLFAFLTDALAYRANRIPERDRLKFLQLLGIPLRPATPASGLVTIANQRAPLQPLPLNAGLVLSAGKLDFQTLDGLNVLPLEARAYYKQPIDDSDPRRQEFETRYEALRLAAEADLDRASSDGQAARATLAFYESRAMTLPTAAEPSPVLDLATSLDKSLYLALLAPPGGDPDQTRKTIARQTLSLGLVPALAGEIAPLTPLRFAAPSTLDRRLIFELPGNPDDSDAGALYSPLRPLNTPDLEALPTVVQLPLPGADALRTWSFDDPLREGVEDFPPRIADPQVAARLVTWIRLRIGAPDGGSAPPSLRLTWAGINAARVIQAATRIDEFLGVGNGEPNQSFSLAHTPVLARSVSLVGRTENGGLGRWYRTDDLLAAGPNDPVFDLDPEAGLIRFGDGLRGARPPRNVRLLATYQYGGGPAGNLAIGAINASRDTRLKGGFRIENPVPTSGGAPGETPAEGERNIPRIVRHRERLVTQQDYRDVALRAEGIHPGRIEVLPLYRPGTPPDLDAAGSVTLLAVPAVDPLNPLWPTPDRLFLRRLCDYLDERRPITTEIHVRGPDYVPVYLTLAIQVRGDFFADSVRTEVGRRLRRYLSSLPPGGSDGRGWSLNKPLLAKDLEAVASRVPGVGYVEELRLGGNGPIQRERIELAGLQLPLVAALEVSVGTTALALEALVAEPTPAPVPGVSVVPVPVVEETC